MHDAPAGFVTYAPNGAAASGKTKNGHETTSAAPLVEYVAADGEDHYAILRQGEALRREVAQASPPYFMVEVLVEDGSDRRRALQVLFDIGILHRSPYAEGYIVPEQALKVLDHFKVKYQVGQRFTPDDWS